MGVLGLTPFLQKTCPEVIKLLPDRLRTLTGKTIVIDGTLVTQRLHFAQVPHPHRHVLGWYRLVKELETCGVSAICVFDGKERSAAKAQEAKRRKEVQRVAAEREILENERLKRLRNLGSILGLFQKLGDDERELITGDLRGLSAAVTAQQIQDSVVLPSPIPGPGSHEYLDPVDSDYHSWMEIQESEALEVSTPLPVEDDSADLSDFDSYKYLSSPLDQSEPQEIVPDVEDFVDEGLVDSDPDLADFQDSQTSYLPDLSELHVSQKIVEEIIQPDISTPAPNTTLISNDSAPASSLTQPTQSIEHERSPESPSEPTSTSSESHTVSPSPSKTFLSSTLTTLYNSYLASIPKIASLQSLPSHSPPSSPSPEDDVQAEIRMSKTQYQLTLDEGKLWTALTSPVPPPLEAAHPAPPEPIADENKVDTAADSMVEPTPTAESESDPNSQSQLLPTPDSPLPTPDPSATLVSLTEKSSLISESYKRRAHPATAETYAESKELLQAMGVPCIDVDGAYEAEALASSLVLNGVADYVASEDTDVLVYGAPLIRNITNRQGPLVLVSGSEVRTSLSLTHQSYIDFALLLGTDFSQRIKNVGPMRALKFIRLHGSIERVLELEGGKYPPRGSPEAYLAQVEAGRGVFGTLPPVPDAKALEQGEKDEERTRGIMHKYRLGREVMNEWDYKEALDGNYFGDNPSASASASSIVW